MAAKVCEANLARTRYVAIAIFLAWLLLLVAYPSLPLMFVALSWVVFTRANRTAEKVRGLLNVVHEEAVKDRLLIMTVLLKPFDDPEAVEWRASLIERLERMTSDPTAEAPV